MYEILSTDSNFTAEHVSAHDGDMKIGWTLPNAAAVLMSMQTRSQRLELVLERLCRDLNTETDLELNRLSMGISSLNPQIMTRIYHAFPNQQGKLETHSQKIYTDQQFQNSPLPQIYEYGVGTRICIARNQTGNYGIEDDLKKINTSDYIILPLIFHNGIGGHIAWSTERQKGWTEKHLCLLHALSSLLSLRADGDSHAFRLHNITETYLGKICGEKVLSGCTGPGKTDTLNAALLFCKLHQLSSVPDANPDHTLTDINTSFTPIMSAITNNGGDIIKFIDDSVLALYPTKNNDDSQNSHASAYRSACEIQSHVNTINQNRQEAGLPAIHAGITLHTGSVTIGHAGSINRLDVKIIGQTANETIEIENFCQKLSVSLLASKAFVNDCPDMADKIKSIGHHALNCTEQHIELFTDKN